MKWVIKYAALYVDAGLPERLCYIPAGSVVEPTGNEYTVRDVPFSEVLYTTSVRTYRGWIKTGYLEELVNEFPLNVVPTNTQTSNPNDPAQDIMFLGNIQYNLCGEFCVAYMVGDSIENFLALWQPHSPNVFNRIFSGGRSRPTGIGDLQDMLSVYSLSGVSLTALLTDSLGMILSPGRLSSIVSKYQVIVGVKIDGVTGNLRGQGVGHWICLERVIPDGRNRGWVEFYNPFPNQMQRESWGTLTASMGVPYGLAVKRS